MAFSKKARAPFTSSALSEKVQKPDLSLEAYAHAFLSVQQDLHFNLNFCSLDNLRKILLANNLSPGKATKELIVTHFHELPISKPFFTSLEGSNNKNLLVNVPVAIKHADLVEDLNALQWLEYGQVLLEADAQSLLGVPVGNASSSTRQSLPAKPESGFNSHVAVPLNPVPHNSGNKSTEKIPYTEFRKSGLKSGPLPGGCKARPHYKSLPKIVQNSHQQNTTFSQLASHHQNALKQSCSLIDEDENACRDQELTLCQLKRKEGEEISSSALGLKTQDTTQDALKQLAPSESINWKEIGNPLQIGSSFQDTTAQLSFKKSKDRDELEESTLSNRSITKTAAHYDLTWPGLSQYPSRREGREAITTINSAQPLLQSGLKIQNSGRFTACHQPLHRKEEEVLIGRASQIDKEMIALETSAAFHNDPTSSSMSAADNACVSSPSKQLSKTAHKDWVQPAFPQISSCYAAGQTKNFLCPSAHEEESLAAAPEMDPEFDPASAGFLQVLHDSTTSMSGCRSGALSACNEISLNLLDEWKKRKQQTSEPKVRTTTKMLHEEKTRLRSKRMHLEQGSPDSEGGDCTSFFSLTAIAERCNSLREETSKLLSECDSSV